MSLSAISNQSTQVIPINPDNLGSMMRISPHETKSSTIDLKWAEGNIKEWANSEIEKERQCYHHSTKDYASRIDSINKAAQEILELCEAQNNPHVVSMKAVFSNLGLRSLPDCFQQLKKITSLYLDGSDFKEFPKSILELKHLGKLYLSTKSNDFDLPPEISKLSNLHWLCFHTGTSKNFQNEICKLKNLEYLNITTNFDTSIPKEIGQLKRLKTLIVFGENCTKLPKEITHLKQLKKLSLHEKNIRPFPRIIQSMPWLQKFSINTYGTHKSLTDSCGRFPSASDKENIDQLLHANYDKFHLIYPALEKYGMVEPEPSSFSTTELSRPLGSVEKAVLETTLGPSTEYTTSAPVALIPLPQPTPLIAEVSLNQDTQGVPEAMPFIKNDQIATAVRIVNQPSVDNAANTAHTQSSSATGASSANNGTQAPTQTTWQAFKNRLHLFATSASSSSGAAFQQAQRLFQRLRANIWISSKPSKQPNKGKQSRTSTSSINHRSATNRAFNANHSPNIDKNLNFLNNFPQFNTLHDHLKTISTRLQNFWIHIRKIF